MMIPVIKVHHSNMAEHGTSAGTPGEWAELALEIP
ncbi:hypothetical protein N7517_008419 [Penicillium concentricum]|uniref:Uncharacterized protein n=1 Tax=Penicillium concentricum TaxID=293559 RepID=A0A9W9RX82_9EURO|nr:uncharacterized protein N7517_008419 [Penicillium concentricum]KAJ5365533.1 hypothetical protein N7517_008419 [Penicillium concentricum]